MKRRRRGRDGKSGLDILEEAMHLLRAKPLSLAPYYFGSLPFILGLLYFWTDMSTGSHAWKHCPQAAWGLTLLFVWMKTWQSVYARGLTARIRGEPLPPWGLRPILRTAAIQTAIQPWSILVLPVAFLILLPFPQAFAFFQNVTLLGSGDERDMRMIMQKSWRQASLWPTQNGLIIWLASPFLLIVASFFIFVLLPIQSSFNPGASVSYLFIIAALVVVPLCPLGMITAFNIGVTVLLVPWLLKTLFDFETLFSLGSAHALNITFFAVVCSLSTLCLDPVMKACYCLRCFYGESLQTGEDLKVELRSRSVAGATVIILLTLLLGVGSPGNVLAEPSGAGISRPEASVQAQQLDSAIENILAYPEYAWRMPREKPPDVEARHGALYEFIDSIHQTLEQGWNYVKKGLTKVRNFVKKLLSRIRPSLPKVSTPDVRWTPFSRALIIAPLVCVVILLAFLAWRAWKQRRPQRVIGDTAVKTVPDITREDLDATELPEDGWLQLARELTETGERRLALRALYLATLSLLARQELLTIAKYKSDREYEQELRRRSHTRPSVAGLFAENRVLFENAWYGLHEVTSAIMERFSQNQESIKVNVQR